MKPPTSRRGPAQHLSNDQRSCIAATIIAADTLHIDLDSYNNGQLPCAQHRDQCENDNSSENGSKKKK
jgi:hypothetical protein